MPDSYEKLRPYWEAWKANNKKPSDPKESQSWEGMVEIFRAVAGQPSTKANQEAVNFILESLPHWRSELINLPDSDKSANRIKLYRGVTDEPAILLRKALKDASDWCERELGPICYSTDIDVAFAFASKGHIDGSVYSICVALDSVLFSDLEGHYQEAGLHHEKEVVVWHKSPLAVTVINPNVEPRQPLCRSRSDLDKWRQETQKLKEKERQFMNAKVEGWNFSVVGCDSHDWPKYLGFKDTYEEAVEFQTKMANAGWRRVAIFDAAHQEVKEKPKTLTRNAR